jgi:hypothetical protein
MPSSIKRHFYLTIHHSPGFPKTIPMTATGVCWLHLEHRLKITDPGTYEKDHTPCRENGLIEKNLNWALQTKFSRPDITSGSGIPLQEQKHQISLTRSCN